MKIASSTLIAALCVSSCALAPLAAFAQESGSVTAGIHLGLANGGKASSTQSGVTAEARMKERASSEITRRIDNLNKMLTRFSDMARLSADEKASLTATINTQISSLTALNTKIQAEGTTTLKDDVQSITKSYRIYALVMPQSAIMAAGDRILTIAAQMQALSTKLQARITASGNTSLQASLDAFNTKVADAKTQAQAAIDEVKALTPDNGDQTKAAANLAALKDARSKLQAARTGLETARKDVTAILRGVLGKGTVNAGAPASSSAQSQ